MSKQSYSEVEARDEEVREYLDEIYPDEVEICGMSMTQSYILQHLDRPAFDEFASQNMNWYKCDICDTVYKNNGAEDKAMECCQKECSECGKDLDDDWKEDMCEDCQIEAEDIDSESNE